MQTTGPFKKIGIIARPRGSNLAKTVPPLLQWLEKRGIEANEERVSRIYDRAKQASAVLDDDEIMQLV